jgi:nitrile hydratase accessory protein
VNDTPSPPVFDEPWEAKVFAMAVRLQERGLFTWPEWTDALGAEIATGTAATGNSYYEHWLHALEALLNRKGVASPDELARYCAAWGRAAARTPHGLPVELSDGDLR